MHDAAIAWVDNVTETSFTAYARALDKETIYINWVAYQVNIHTRTKGALVGGTVTVPDFRQGTCTADINQQVREGIR